MNRHFQFASLLVISAAGFVTPRAALAQGTFQNLDFESATIPIIPAGEFGSPVPVAQALPGWTAYLPNITTVNQIGHNDLSLGGEAIIIFGPQWHSSDILQGNYTILLETAFIGGAPQPSLTAAIGQTGLVPSSAESVRFFAVGSVKVTFNGQVIPLFQLGSRTNYTVYGGDISAFAGQTGELRFTSPASGPVVALLDNIYFSTQPIPEPSVLGLFALGLSFLGWRSRSKRRSICNPTPTGKPTCLPV